MRLYQANNEKVNTKQRERIDKPTNVIWSKVSPYSLFSNCKKILGFKIFPICCHRWLACMENMTIKSCGPHGWDAGFATMVVSLAVFIQRFLSIFRFGLNCIVCIYKRVFFWKVNSFYFALFWGQFYFLFCHLAASIFSWASVNHFVWLLCVFLFFSFGGSYRR